MCSSSRYFKGFRVVSFMLSRKLFSFILKFNGWSLFWKSVGPFILVVWIFHGWAFFWIPSPLFFSFWLMLHSVFCSEDNVLGLYFWCFVWQLFLVFLEEVLSLFELFLFLWALFSLHYFNDFSSFFVSEKNKKLFIVFISHFIPSLLNTDLILDLSSHPFQLAFCHPPFQCVDSCFHLTFRSPKHCIDTRTDRPQPLIYFSTEYKPRRY